MSKIAVVLVFFFALAMQVNGWWDTGHMLVSQIAYKHLTADPSVSADLLHALNNAVNSIVTYAPSSNTFVTAACWMDDLKYRNLIQFNNWHYINLPICEFTGENDTDGCETKSQGYVSVESVLNSDDEDVLWAIGLAQMTMNGSSALGFERGFALRNLLHLVGDLHQPLHSAQRYCNETPNGDQGGNYFPVKNVSYASNLHSLWDSGVGYLAATLSRPLNQSSASFISDMADTIIAKTANLTQNQTVINTTQWALDARQLAITYAYNLSWASTPSDYYIAQAWNVIQDQIGLAGYRLHLILKQTRLCNGNINCPDSEQTLEKKDKTWFIVGIALAAVLGVSLIVNIVLIVRNSKRNKYSPVQ